VFGSILLINMAGDLEDLEDILSEDPTLLKDPFRRRGSCSALIRLTDDNADLFVSHVRSILSFFFFFEPLSCF
jgi:hypothetical protein